MNSEADNERIFKEQLARTRAGYFDFYFLHWLNEAHWEKAKTLKTLDFMKSMQAEGKIRRRAENPGGANPFVVPGEWKSFLLQRAEIVRKLIVDDPAD